MINRRKRLIAELVIIVIIVVVKVIWLHIEVAKQIDEKSGEIAWSDITQRRDYLLSRTTEKDPTTEDSTNAMYSSLTKSEWDLVTYSMFSAALTNIALRDEKETEASKKAIEKLIRVAIQKSFQEFDKQAWGGYPLENLKKDNGYIAYLAHLNIMLGAYKRLGGSEFNDLYDDVSKALYNRYHKVAGYCLPTYPGQYYYPDNIAAVASVAIYSKLHQDVYGEFLNDYVAYYREMANKDKYGLMPFYLDEKCEATGYARGSSSFWNVYYMSFIDFDFAKGQYELAKKEFYQERLSIHAFREAPREIIFFGDVDSGPAILGFSPSGSGFAFAGAALFNDTKILKDLTRTAELAGTSITIGGKKRYLLAPLVGDAIILAMKTQTNWFYD